MGSLVRFLTILFWTLSLSVYSQSILDVKLDGSERGKNLVEFLEEFERTHEVRFYFVEDWLSSYTIEGDYAGQSLEGMLKDLLRDSRITYASIHTNGIVFIKDPTYEMERRNALITAARRQSKVDRRVIGALENYKPGHMVSLRGRITHEDTKAPVAGATIQLGQSMGGTSTDNYGMFEMKIPTGEHVVTIAFVSLKERVVDLTVYEGGELNLSMQEAAVLLQEVVVNSLPISELTNSRAGQLQLAVGAMKKQPTLMGEADLVRQLQTLPGVSTTGEAASGFNVRGGSVDQNLVLYDGMPVFNTSHSLGFFSAFYSEAIREMTFYRGGIPAEYGGRASSVLDIRSKGGDPQKWRGSGGIGLVSANLMVRGPLKKDKTTIAASVRTTYADWYIDALSSSYQDLSESEVSFYDTELRLDHSFNDHSKLTFSFYRSNDKLRVRGDTTFQWSNQLASVKLDQIFSDRLSGNFQLGLGTYQYGVTDRQPDRAFQLDYQITYPSLKADFQYITENQQIEFGLQSMYYNFKPGTLAPTSSESVTKAVTIESQYAIESGIYLSDLFTFDNRFSVEVGLRLSSFVTLGPATVNIYQPQQPVSLANLIDSVKYPSGETTSSNFGLEPRFALRYSLTRESSLKLSYHRMYQYLHLISNTTAITPVDIWQPSNTFFKPQFADQISLGYFRDFKEKKYEAFIEGFYKRMSNVMDFKDGAQLILNKTLEADLLQGHGEAYGVETYISKNIGRLTWALSYTYSRSLRTIMGATPIESINGGATYPSSYDQPHILNASWDYRISKRFSFTGNFAYRTGRPVTVPSFGFLLDGYTIAHFSDRNEFRIPDYHRLDVALVIEGNHKLVKPWSGSWIISFLNVYGRRNAYSYFFGSDIPGRINTYQLSILGTVIPSLTYSFKF